MVKKQRNRGTTRIRELAEEKAPEWTSLFAAFEEAFDWALDVGVQLARDYPEEVDAVERVRTFMQRRIAGLPSPVPIDDVLFTFGLIIGAIERDLGPIGTQGPWFAPAMHLPSASEFWEPRIPRPRRWTFDRTPFQYAAA